MFQGNLNDSIDVRKFLTPYKTIAKSNRCLILFCHHIGKGKENSYSPIKNDVLGSQAIEAACRTVMMLRKRNDGKRILTVVKGNSIPDELKNTGMVLEFNLTNGFKFTGEKIFFGETGNISNVPDKCDDDRQAEVIELYEQLKSYEKVSAAMRVKGYKIDKNKVGKIVKKGRPSVTNAKVNSVTDENADKQVLKIEVEEPTV